MAPVSAVMAGAWIGFARPLRGGGRGVDAVLQFAGQRRRADPDGRDQGAGLVAAALGQQIERGGVIGAGGFTDLTVEVIDIAQLAMGIGVGRVGGKIGLVSGDRLATSPSAKAWRASARFAWVASAFRCSTAATPWPASVAATACGAVLPS
ncbi:MAG: hypothetical protein R3D85_00960 [Paracoccaceae bacterium]